MATDTWSLATPQISVVIPVFNSESTVATVIDGVRTCLDAAGREFEIIAINDGSQDRSWQEVSKLAEADSRVIAIDLLQNYGQHTALLCGLDHSRGEYVVTMDDDLQNPPDQIINLIGAASEGADVVFGRYRTKQTSWYRNFGSRMVRQINIQVFSQPRDLEVSNFRLLDRRVVDRICSTGNRFPYISGQALLYSKNPINIDVTHDKRTHGRSNYGVLKIARLIARILFSYSIIPLRVVSIVGCTVAMLSGSYGLYQVIRGIIGDTIVDGWLSMITMTSFLGGMIILMLGIIGEYLIRILSHLNDDRPYLIDKIVRCHNHSQ
jgi:glycosyltransferase involved in cell wall biosynthesis